MSDLSVAERILIIEDEIIFAKGVAKRLNKAGYETEIASGLAMAREKIKSFNPSLLLLDMRLPDGSGLEILCNIEQQDNLAVIVMSAYGELEDAVSAMKLGAVDYLKKPVDLEELLLTVERVFEQRMLTRKLNYSSTRERHANIDESQFLGKCPVICEVLEKAKQITKFFQQSDGLPPSVLILGETGTGKDLVARFLHANSIRKTRPFVHVDCASLPRELIESELFGHEKGAFTSAHTAHTGLIEAAEDGVLFLDEIGELPIELQAKLLAVLERHSIRRVGTTKERPVLAWIIAATNRDIEQLSQQGKFRSDLFFRLNIFNIHLPALSQRQDDILLLANHFAQQTAKKYGLSSLISFTEEAKIALQQYEWPGNVRELKHLIERATLLSQDNTIQAITLGLHSIPSSRKESVLDVDNMTLDEAELSLIKNALEKSNHNVSQAARKLAVTRMALRYRMKKYNL